MEAQDAEDLGHAIPALNLKRVIDAKIAAIGGESYIECVVLDSGVILVPAIRRLTDGRIVAIIRLESI